MKNKNKMPGNSHLKIVVLGYIVRGPLGGLAWHHLQYVIGLKKMGHEVLFLEDSDDFPGCYNPETFELGVDPQYGLAFLKNLFTHFDLNNHWSYYDAHTGQWHGKSRDEVFLFCSKADMVLNLSAVNPVRDWWAKIPSRILIDTDPSFTQIKHLTSPKDFETAKQHTAFFSFGENIGKHNCHIPADGFDWKPTRQPVVMDIWNETLSPTSEKWTTVMQWDSYKMQQYDNRIFGMKSMSFREYDKLPQLLPSENFELALGSITAPVEELKANGWNIISSLVPTKSPYTYQQYIQQSKGEWSIAKHGYVISNSGWFSERSTCYMATGKPVIVQDTGFTGLFPVGEGLLCFSNIDEAVEQIKRVCIDYKLHCSKAREIIKEHFEASLVLQDLIDLIN